MVIVQLAIKSPCTVLTCITTFPGSSPGVKIQFNPSTVISPRFAPLSTVQITWSFTTLLGVNTAFNEIGLPLTIVVALFLSNETPSTSRGVFDSYFQALSSPAPIRMVSIVLVCGFTNTISKVSSFVVPAGLSEFSKSYLDNALFEEFTVVLISAYPFSEYPK